MVYYRDMRTYERALESLYQKLRISGVEFINGEVTGIESAKDNGGLVLSVDPIRNEDDEDEAEAVNLEADLVVLAAAQTPSRGSNELYRMFGVEVDRHGYPVENQPRLFRPTESLVNRVFVVGASSGPKVVQQASEQGSAAAMRALPSLLSGQVEPLRYASRVNPDRCIKCRTCETVCPHGAIRMTEEGAVSDPAFCQACGFCAAACPVHAAELTNFTDQQILAQARVAFSSLAPDEPRILALLCYWCAYSAADFAGIERTEAPANYRAIRIRCSSSVNTALLMQMFDWESTGSWSLVVRSGAATICGATSSPTSGSIWRGRSWVSSDSIRDGFASSTSARPCRPSWSRSFTPWTRSSESSARIPRPFPKTGSYSNGGQEKACRLLVGVLRRLRRLAARSSRRTF